MSFTLTTSSFSPEKSSIVGFAFSFGKKEGFYVPVAHLVNENLDSKASLDIIYEQMVNSKIVFFYQFRRQPGLWSWPVMI